MKPRPSQLDDLEEEEEILENVIIRDLIWLILGLIIFKVILGVIKDFIFLILGLIIFLINIRPNKRFALFNIRPNKIIYLINIRHNKRLSSFKKHLKILQMPGYVTALHLVTD